MSLIPTLWMPKVPMKRIIMHWTAGTHKANATDKAHYHILIQGDGTLVRGDASISLNSGKTLPGYAAHTLNCNTDSIGVSLCCMGGAVESPFNPGKWPMTKEQFDTLIKVVNELRIAYKIPVTRKTILSHAEVQQTLGITQRNKWDYTRLAFDDKIRGALVIGDHIRSLVSSSTEAAPAPVASKGVVKTNGGNLTMRATPSGVSKGSLPNGTKVDILERSVNWYRVRTPAGYEGWVSSQYVNLTS